MNQLASYTDCTTLSVSDVNGKWKGWLGELTTDVMSYWGLFNLMAKHDHFLLPHILKTLHQKPIVVLINYVVQRSFKEWIHFSDVYRSIKYTGSRAK